MDSSAFTRDGENFRKITFSPNSEHICFDKNHFPMYEINRKMERIVNSKTVPRLRERTLDATEFAARRMRKTIAQEMEPLNFQHDLTNQQTCQSGSRQFEERPNMMVSNDIEDEIFDDHSLLNAGLAVSKFADSQTKDDSEVATAVNWCLLSRTESGDREITRDSKVVHFCGPSAAEKINMDFPHLSSDKRSNLFIRGVRNSEMGITMHTELSAQEKLVLDPKQTANAKGAALFELLTVPAKSSLHRRSKGEVKPLVLSSRILNGENGRTHTIGRREDSSVQTASTADAGALRTRTFLEGLNSGGPQKDLTTCSNPTKFPHPSPSPVKQITEQRSTVLPHNACVSGIELYTSKTESMNVDEVLPHTQICRSNTSNSDDMVEKSMQAKLSRRCLKRLSHEPPDACALGTKRMKIGGSPISTEICSMLAKLPGAPELSCGRPPSDTQHWVRRWCFKKPQRPGAAQESAAAGSKLCDSEHLRVVHGNLDGKQFPSIRALALMGRAMNNFQVGGFHRMGSSVVWRNMEEI